MNMLYFLLWPFVSAFALFAFRGRTRAAQWANVAFQVVWMALLWPLVSFQQPGSTELFPIGYSWNWLPQLKSSLALGVDGLNLPLLVLNVVLSLCLALYSLGKEKLGSTYLALFSILNGASVGSLLAADALAFYFFWEFMLIPMYFLIGKWGSKNRVYAAMKFFAMTMAGSLALLIAIIALGSRPEVASLGWHDLAALKLPFSGWGSVQGLLFLGFLAAFVVKVPVWPFHTWLPDAHTEAPTGGSVILAGVLLKLGVYGIARWCLPLFPEAAAASAPVLLALGCAGVILGSFGAWVQKDVKRLIAYSSVAHLGFMVIGLFALRAEAFQGALFQNIAHGLSTGALFLIFGMIYDRTHSREIAAYGGFAKNHAWISTAFLLAVFASVGLPGLPGFVGEFLVLVGSFPTAPWAAIVASLGVLLGAIYMLMLTRKMFFGPESELVASHPVKLSWNEWLAVLPLIVGMLWLGFGANGLLQWSEGGVRSTLDLMAR
jgi:NADH-quinone oxidoreductase subunit M